MKSNKHIFYTGGTDWIHFHKSFIVYRWVSVKWTGATKRHYTSLGYLFTKLFDSFLVDVKHLSAGSSQKVFAYCPVCKKIRPVSWVFIRKANSSRCKAHSGFVDLQKQKFGRLEPISYFQKQTTRRNRVYWKCKCTCGKIVSVRQDILLSGKTKSCGCLHVEIMKKRIGKKHQNWNSQLTNKDRKRARHTLKYKKWRDTIYKRDNHTCQRCGKRGGPLVVHHINDYSTHKEQRYMSDNGTTLCRKCHKAFHLDYMGSWRKPCTLKDYQGWIEQVF